MFRQDAPTPGPSTDEYFESWLRDRAQRGVRDTDTEQSRYLHHVQSAIGAIPIAQVTADDLSRLVLALEVKIRGDEITWKTANNVWTVVSALFRDAKSSRRAELRVRENNPAAEMLGPDRRLLVIRRKSYLYPDEFARLVECDKVPVRWARFYALAVYTYGRAGEQAALQCSDIDMQARTIHFYRQLCAKTAVLRPTKENAEYAIPIEPNLFPLLRVMMNEVGESGFLLQARRDAGEIRGLPRNDLSERLRGHLRTAGIARELLYGGNPLRKPITFHDLRGTAATWMALRGDAPLTIMQRMGHRQFSTTQGYIQEAEAVGQGAEIGIPFPPLAERLLRRRT